MKARWRFPFLIVFIISLAACSPAGGGKPGAAVPSPTATMPPALLPVTPVPPTATPNPFLDQPTMLIYGQLEADNDTIRSFMQGDPARRAMFGGAYIEHPSGVQIGAPDSFNVLQLVAGQAEADALLAQLPPLNYPSRLQVNLVQCTEDHLNELMERRMPALDATGALIGGYLDTKGNRVSWLIKASPDYTVVDGLIDKTTLPPDVAAELADPCIVVSQGTPVTISRGGDPLDGTTWQLAALPGHEATLAQMPDRLIPTLRFAGGGFTFVTGCNDPSSFYVADGDRLTATLQVMHLMLCVEIIGEDGMAVESALYEAMTTFSTFAIEGDTLRIGYEGGELALSRLP